MRKLIVIRIVHSPTDMGSASASLEKAGISTLGKQRWQENQKKIESFWLDLEKEVDDLGLDVGKLRIYQDGLPCAGALGERIVRETAAKGSKNYQIVQKLMDRGAKIEATESADLLRQEYGYIKALLEAKTDEMKRMAEERYNQVKDKLLEDRDLFIARAIDATLAEGETGLLFIGASHNVLPKIAGDIEVKCLD
ncbi:hypothetical protein [Methanothrix soehngenii]|jgi:hypothetical protein|uniref:hypothetical protein n=1 Tax=Methanothrix soehngenii TaxID=2223 RepID=UPI0023F004EC|nr:hypothetical protein [Methanothrix soehngenii]MDD5734068.1 hypothetical protein [Methanothrix soehngenii]